jgi:fused signal recognition particle receptor
MIEEADSKGWLSRLRDGLSRSSGRLGESISSIFTKTKLEAETLDALEETLIAADFGVATARKVCETLRGQRFERGISEADVRSVLAQQIEEVLSPLAKPLDVDRGHSPHVVLVVGVNGVGKTTTIAKLSNWFLGRGRRILLVAGDTFRAAAVEQLTVWGERLGVPVLRTRVGGDPAGLAFEALEQARAQGQDVVVIDTAGRLQNKKDLMEELAKIRRVLAKLDASAPHDVLLVLDATTGQNALNQIQVFQEIAGVTGLVMTKLDGTARGGILVAAGEKYGLPVHAIGIGEKMQDLRPFLAHDFARTLAGLEEEEA